ncbi:uncharacterized protein LOC124132766 [Haliotis rufescens]|uniref:uncharacterized protein LOC124132766 n=1 Tax=Haliotis rufescens TaxID=6454 RepID=UPI00201FB395|nr:uncharacterized protein LOC124132766 [Haliotis rufescens]
MSARDDNVTDGIHKEILEIFLNQCCANKELASKLKLHQDQRETRKRYSGSDEGIDSRPNSESVASAGPVLLVSRAMRIQDLGRELKGVIDEVVAGVLKSCGDESLQAVGARMSVASTDSGHASNRASGGVNPDDLTTTLGDAMSAWDDNVADGIHKEVLEILLNQCCANKALASKLKLHQDQRETRKRYSGSDEGIDSRPNSESVASAGPVLLVSRAMRIQDLGRELQGVIDEVVAGVLKSCGDESLQAVGARISVASTDSGHASNRASGGDLHLAETTTAEQDHELHNPPLSLVRDYELVERMSAAALSNRLTLRDGHPRQSVPTEHTEQEEQTVPKRHEQ